MGLKTIYTSLLILSMEQPLSAINALFKSFYSPTETCILNGHGYNYGVNKYELGNAFGHIAIGVDDCYSACIQIALLGGNIVREAGPLAGSDEVIAFVEDPDGYKIELIDR